MLSRFGANVDRTRRRLAAHGPDGVDDGQGRELIVTVDIADDDVVDAVARQIRHSIRRSTADAQTVPSADGGENEPAEPADVPDDTAGDSGHTGAMIALVPTEQDGRRLAVAGGEPVDELHVTLQYLGAAADIEPAVRQQVIGAVTAGFAGSGPIEAQLFGLAWFNPNGEEPCVVGLVGGSPIWQAHEAAEAAAEGCGIDCEETYEPWVAHITMAYTADGAMVHTLADRCGPVTFDRIRVAFAGDYIDIPLTGQAPSPSTVTDAAE